MQVLVSNEEVLKKLKIVSDGLGISADEALMLCVDCGLGAYYVRNDRLCYQLFIMPDGSIVTIQGKFENTAQPVKEEILL